MEAREKLKTGEIEDNLWRVKNEKSAKDFSKMNARRRPNLQRKTAKNGSLPVDFYPEETKILPKSGPPRMIASNRVKKVDAFVGVIPSTDRSSLVASGEALVTKKKVFRDPPPLALRHRIVAMVLMMLLPMLPSRGATVYWDADGLRINNVFNQALTGQGATGSVLNIGMPLWWDGNSSNQGWNNARNDTAVFGGTAGTVTLGTGVNLTVGGLQFNSAGYVLALGTNTMTFGAADNAISLNSLAQANALTAMGATITGAVAGTGNVTFSGGLAAGLAGSTLTLNGTSTSGWSGSTTIGVGQTLALAGNQQALRDTSSIMLNGGGITLTNTNAAEAALNRVSDTATILSNGGTLSVANTASATVNYSETLGALTLNSGRLTISQSNNNTSPSTQTLAFGAITRNGGSANTSQLNFAGASLGAAAQNVITISGQSATTASIAPWMTYGGTDFAAYSATNGVVAATATNLTASVVGLSTTDYNAATVTLGSDGSMRTLKFGGGAALTVTGAGTT